MHRLGAESSRLRATRGHDGAAGTGATGRRGPEATGPVCHCHAGRPAPRERWRFTAAIPQ